MPRPFVLPGHNIQRGRLSLEELLEATSLASCYQVRVQEITRAPDEGTVTSAELQLFQWVVQVQRRPSRPTSLLSLARDRERSRSPRRAPGTSAATETRETR